MSQVEEAIALYNNRSAEDRLNATLEHMAEMERQRKASEAAINNSEKGAWEKRRAKWNLSKSPKVLLGIPQQLQ